MQKTETAQASITFFSPSFFFSLEHAGQLRVGFLRVHVISIFSPSSLSEIILVDIMDEVCIDFSNLIN